MTRLALAAVALVLALSACGGVESEPNLAKAVESTEATGSFAFEMTTRFEDAGDEVDWKCSGAVDSTRRRTRFACPDPAPEGTHETITVDDTTYNGYPGADGRWWKLPAGDEVPVPEEYSHDRFLGLLRTASQETERVGEEDVRGEPTVRYALTVDCEQAELYDCASPTAVVDAWIDDDGLIRRVAFDQGTAARVSIEYFDFGKPVEIEAPPAGQIEEWPAFPDVPCMPDKADPVRVGQAREALRRAGFDVRPDDSGCGDGIAAQLTNLNDDDPGFDVLAQNRGYLICTVRTSSPNAMWFTLLPSWQGAPAHVTRSVENLHCTLWAEGSGAQERIAALEAAIDELRRELRP